MSEARQELFDKIKIALLNEHYSNDTIDRIYVILSEYEVQSRCTEVAIVEEDRNMALIQKWLVAKMVKGCTERTVKLYKTEVSRIIGSIRKTVDDITADDIRLYTAIRTTRDKISKVTADNEIRYLRSFF